MRILARLVAIAAVVMLLGVVAAWLLMPRILANESVRARIKATVDGAVGSEVRYADLDFGILPPSLRANGVTVAGAKPEAPNLVEAEQVALRVALLPLFARVVVIDSFSVRGLRARLVRTADGFELPFPRAAAESKPAAEGDGPPVDIVPAGFDLHDAAIVIEDRTRKPAVTWDLQDIQLRARGENLDAPVEFDLSLALASGGRIEATGSATLAGDFDVKAQLEAVALAPTRAYVDGISEFAGRMTGSVTARGAAGSPASLSVDAVVEDTRLQVDDLTLRGRVKVEAEVRELAKGPTGSFDIDATAAEVQSGSVFTKPSGTAATVTGEIATGDDGTLKFDVQRLKIRNFEGTAQVRTGKRTRIVLNAPPFELDGWEALIPALAEYDLSGPARIENLKVTTSPMDVRGAVVLDGVTGVLPDRGPVRIDGALVGEGDVVNTQNMRLVAASQNIDVTGTFRNLDRDVGYSVKLATSEADTNELVSTFTSKRDFIYGLLTLDGDFRGSAAGPRPPLESLQGRAHFDIDEGRMKGVSLLQLTFERFGEIGTLAVLASQLLGGPDLTPFYADDFREISGTFDVRDGVARTDDLRIIYRDYTVDLHGSLGLSDSAIDMRGRITIGERIDQALRRDPNASNTIELGGVTGTLEDPKVHVSPDVVAAFLGRSKAGGKIDKAIDDAVGKEVGDLIEGILGGRSQRR